MNSKFLAALLLAPLSFGIAAASLAGDTPAPNQVAVPYSHRDLGSAAGKESLKRRLTAAAESVCPDPYSADLETRVVGKRCIRQAVERAMNDLTERQLARAAAVNGDRG